MTLILFLIAVLAVSPALADEPAEPMVKFYYKGPTNFCLDDPANHVDDPSRCIQCADQERATLTLPSGRKALWTTARAASNLVVDGTLACEPLSASPQH